MAGLRPFCEDGRFIIDKVDEIEGVVLATGHHGTGVSLAPVTGQLVAEMIAKNRKPSSIEEFGYARFKNHSLEEKEQMEVGGAS
jgi:sarcosine oxidase subunit beta